MADSYKVEYADEAKEDIHQILHYLNTTYSTETATNIYRNILEEVESIAKMPSVKSPYGKKKFEYRFTIVKNKYRIVYTIIEKKLMVILVRIFGRRMDKPTVLASIKEEE